MIYDASLFSNVLLLVEIDHDLVLTSIKLSDDFNVRNKGMASRHRSLVQLSIKTVEANVILCIQK